MKTIREVDRNNVLFDLFIHSLVINIIYLFLLLNYIKDGKMNDWLIR